MKISLIGHNLTSLILAQILSQKKIPVEIYSTKSHKKKFETRTIGITENNLKYLSLYLKNIKKKVHPIKEIKVLVKNEKENDNIFFSQKSKILFNMVKHRELEIFIKKKLIKNKKVTFKKIKERDLNKFVNNEKFQLVINCERKNYLTIKYLKNALLKDYYNSAFTAIIKHSKIKNNRATQIFTKYGPIAYLPLSDIMTSIVFSIESKKKNNLLNKDVISLIRKLNTSYKIISFSKLENFDLKLSIPKNYYYKNILFFGDSLHSIHPLVGQGFNMTIRDIIRFTEIIDYKLNLGLMIDKNIFKEFEKNVKKYNSLFSLGVDLIYELFRINKSIIPNNISRNFFSFVNKSEKLKNFGIKLANEGIF